jgi:hypothetical protein
MLAGEFEYRGMSMVVFCYFVLLLRSEPDGTHVEGTER